MHLRGFVGKVFKKNPKIQYDPTSANSSQGSKSNFSAASSVLIAVETLSTPTTAASSIKGVPCFDLGSKRFSLSTRPSAPECEVSTSEEIYADVWETSDDEDDYDSENDAPEVVKRVDPVTGAEYLRWNAELGRKQEIGGISSIHNSNAVSINKWSHPQNGKKKKKDYATSAPISVPSMAKESWNAMMQKGLYGRDPLPKGVVRLPLREYTFPKKKYDTTETGSQEAPQTKCECPICDYAVW